MAFGLHGSSACDATCTQGAQDAKRAKMWGTIAKKIIQAAKACGGDPANAKLIEVLKLAKAAEVPKDLIDRNIKKATDKSQADYQEVCPRSGQQLNTSLPCKIITQSAQAGKGSWGAKRFSHTAISRTLQTSPKLTTRRCALAP